MGKLNELTKKQEASMSETRDEWIKFCLGGDNSINRQMAMEGIRWMYGKAKLKNPFVIFVNGPMSCQYAVWVLKSWIKDNKFMVQVGDQVRDQVGAQVRAQVRDQVWAQVGDQVWAQVGDQVRAQVRDQVGDQVWAQVGDQVWDQVMDQVRDQVRAQVGDQVWAQVGDQVMDQVWAQVRDQVWAQVRDQVRAQVRDQVKEKKGEFNDYSWCDLSNSGWLSFYDYFEKIGINVTPDFKKFRDYAKSGYFMTIFLDGFAIVCPRPKDVHRLSTGRLHNEKGPALSWEGEDYWFLNGIRVPEWLVKTEAGQIDPKKALEEKNVDIQREIIRKVGAERMLKACKAETLDVFTDSHTKGGNEYKLMRMKVGQIDRKYLYFENASLPGVWYAQPVHPNLNKALHARAWMLGIGEVEDLEKTSDKDLTELLPVSVS